ncbi:hypothetical protein [Chitinophaga sp. Cy-1792]|uniref:hypothetical protein n=1 Tax=Chitinophaga sp. Cy-1792 TaxID=2608339 RepID=UPI00141ED8C1|nr:hypothetical protein [Chitinophaga sp. Cy-1792]NIG54722.1 hypothetical protein [Chitinophaga sp. Cy-1792]
MRKLFLSISMITAMTACNHQATKSESTDTTSITKSDTAAATVAISPEMLIVPGKQIGITVIRANADSLIKIMGKPDFTDGAMGTYFYTWYKHHDTSSYQASMYSRRNMGGADERITHVNSVYISSPSFKTTEGLGAGTPLADLQGHFTLQRGGVYSNGKDSLIMYDDIPHGISFEVKKGDVCNGVLVYAPNDTTAAKRPIHIDKDDWDYRP